MKNAAVYIRVSTDDQTEYSPDSQLRELKEYAVRHGLVIDPNHIYIDAGISGRAAKKRPAFQQMISEAKAKPSPFDVLLVWKFSRFARNQEESILYKSLLKKECGVDVVSITEETQDNIFGSLIERIIEWMDEFYSIRLGEEVKTKMTLVAEQGKVQTSAPFGYSKKPDEPMVIVPEEAKWIQFIFESFMNGDTFYGIARNLNEYGVKTHRGNKFENRTVEYILHNPMYAGYVRWTPTGKTLSKRIFDSEDTITVKGDFEPIISEDLFNAVQEKIKNMRLARKKRSKPTDIKKHWLSGLVVCHSCGSSLVYQSANNGFQCHSYSKGSCSVSHFISAKKLEDAVLSGISLINIDETFIKENTKANVPRDDNLQVQLEKLNHMLERCKVAYAEGIDSIEEYKNNKERITREIDGINSRIEERKKEVKYASVDEVRSEFNGLLDLLRSDADVNVKHDAFEGIVEKAVFSKGTADETGLELFFRL